MLQHVYLQASPANSIKAAKILFASPEAKEKKCN